MGKENVRLVGDVTLVIPRVDILQGKLTHSVPPWPHTRMKTPPRASHVGLGYMGWESTPQTPSIYLFGVGVAVPCYPIHVDTLHTIFTFRVAMAHGIIFVRLRGLGGSSKGTIGLDRSAKPAQGRPRSHSNTIFFFGCGSWGLVVKI